MKNFDDFAGTLTAEKLCEIAKKVNCMELKITLPLKQENIGQFVNSITSQNYVFFMEILREYHSWLNK